MKFYRFKVSIHIEFGFENTNKKQYFTSLT